ncbi:MAG: hypothetical protein QNJ45_07170 [Ardenticatenaceae bacterium]|nr:hypothetical protein [Ardenticatenaceae bacterium]
MKNRVILSFTLFWLGILQVLSQVNRGAEYDLGTLLLGVLGVVAAGSLLEHGRRFHWLAIVTAAAGISRLAFLQLQYGVHLFAGLQLLAYILLLWKALPAIGRGKAIKVNRSRSTMSGD